MARSIKKGPFIEKKLYKRIVEMSKAGNKKMVKTYSITARISCLCMLPKTWLGINSESLLPHGFSVVMQGPIEKPENDRCNYGSKERL